MYGGASVFYAGGVAFLPRLGWSHGDWNDGFARGETGARGGDVLCDAGDGHGLRLLARRRRGCRCWICNGGAEGERADGQFSGPGDFSCVGRDF